MIEFISKSSIETEKIGQKIAAKLKNKDIIAFYGGLGAGKTTLVRGIVKGLGSIDWVSSPTFAIVNEYDGENNKIYHFDMYRIKEFDDLYSVGFFDYLESDSIIIIEWSENIELELPDNIIKITMKHLNSQNERVIKVEGLDLE